MRPIVLLASVLLLLMSPARAAQAPDPVLVEGLQTFVTNGIEAGLRVWFADRPELGAEMRDLILKTTRNLGTIIDTEIVAVQAVSKRVTRYYVAVYFTRCPLWLRVERYQMANARSIFPCGSRRIRTKFCRATSLSFISPEAGVSVGSKGQESISQRCPWRAWDSVPAQIISGGVADLGDLTAQMIGNLITLITALTALLTGAVYLESLSGRRVPVLVHDE